MGRWRRAGDTAFDLPVHDAVGHQREGNRILVRRLHFQRRPVDGAAVEARRRAGLEPAELEARARHRRRKAHGGLFVHAAGDDLLLADMDQTAQEGSGRQNDGAAGQPPAVGKDDGRDPAVVEFEVLDLGLDDVQQILLGNRLLHGGGVELAVGLGARAANGGALAAVEQAELDAGGVRHPAHQAVERIDLADEMALAQAADRRIAGHRADLVGAQRHKRGARARAGGSTCCLAAGMAAADHHDIVDFSHFSFRFVADRCAQWSKVSSC